MGDKFEEWVDKEIKRLQKQTKRWYCHGWSCVFEFIDMARLELKIAQLKEVKEKYIEIRNGKDTK